MASVRKPVLLYDGHCNLCTASVRFIVRHDREGKILFAPLRSDFAQRFLRENDLKRKGVESLIMVKGNNYVMKSDAVLEAAKILGRPWSWFYIFRVVPAGLRNRIYDFIARYRYNVFGKNEESMKTVDGAEERFLE